MRSPSCSSGNDGNADGACLIANEHGSANIAPTRYEQRGQGKGREREGLQRDDGAAEDAGSAAPRKTILGQGRPADRPSGNADHHASPGSLRQQLRHRRTTK